jgi:hypothetical protein
MTNHTPLPWEASRVITGAIVAIEDRRTNLLGLSVDGYAIFMNPADASLIVKAVNNHERLVEALKAIRDFDPKEYGEGLNGWTEARAFSDCKELAFAALAVLEAQ